MRMTGRDDYITIPQQITIAEKLLNILMTNIAVLPTAQQLTLQGCSVKVLQVTVLEIQHGDLSQKQYCNLMVSVCPVYMEYSGHC